MAMNEIGSHPDIESLGRLVDGRAEPQEAAALRTHLARCRGCMALYAEVVRIRADTLAGHIDLQVSPGLIALGKSLGPRTGRSTAARPGLPVRRSARRRLPTLKLGVTMFAVVLLAAGLNRLGHETRPARADPPPDVVASVRTAIAAASYRGLVFPHVDGLPDSATSNYRGDAAGTAPQLGEAVERLVAARERRPDSPAVTYWLAAGMLAQNRLDGARLALAERRQRFPRDESLAILEAILAHREGKPRAAAALLRLVLARHPDSGLARLDLALVQRELGQTAEAAALFCLVRDSCPGTPLARRAARELATNGARPG
jgi:hypothetical protein